MFMTAQPLRASAIKITHEHSKIFQLNAALSNFTKGCLNLTISLQTDHHLHLMLANMPRDSEQNDADSVLAGPSKRRKIHSLGLSNLDTKRKRSLSRNDYTVGWVCALHIEMAAAHAMLDNIHEDIAVQTGDTNAYTLGDIAGHNIVIACLPSDNYGTNNAATVANNMQRTFPCITVRLMVGIGGGVPGDHVDMRLGDCVIGEKVVQYDMGKAIGGGQFIHKGGPSKPPQAIMTAVARLRAHHESSPSQISSLLSHMACQQPLMSDYASPGPAEDRLFDGNTGQLIPRPARETPEPRIHYGVIASGNQVMKDGRTRDRLAREHNAICFEMESAGLMDSFPCLTIRGISDYSDSHKNDQWQKYAAAVAAAYAKEFLSTSIHRSKPAYYGQ